MATTNNSLRTERFASPPVIDILDTPVDTNDTGSIGPTIDLEGLRNVVLDVQADTGTTTTCVVSIQASVNKSAWGAPLVALTVTGANRAAAVMAERYIRYKVTTAQGVASTSHIQIQAKP